MPSPFLRVHLMLSGDQTLKRKRQTEKASNGDRVPAAMSPLSPQYPAERGPWRLGGVKEHIHLQELQPDVLHREGAEQPHVLSQRPVAVPTNEAGAGEGAHAVGSVLSEFPTGFRVPFTLGSRCLLPSAGSLGVLQRRGVRTAS